MQNIHRYKAKPLRIRTMKKRGINNIQLIKTPAFIMLLGVFFGSLIIQLTGNLTSNYAVLIAAEIISNYKLPFMAVLGYNYLSAFFINTVVILCAFSCFGAPLIMTCIFSNGFIIGLISSYLYLNYGLFGLIANLAIFLLPQLFNSILLLYLCSNAICLSTALFKTILLKKNDIPLKTNICIKLYIKVLIMLLPSSFIFALLSYIFIPLFL